MTGHQQLSDHERVSRSSAWCSDATATLLEAIGSFDDDALVQPSLLPGWTRLHVIAHVHRNAEALGRLMVWAGTGIPTPMYASVEQRDLDIATAAGWAADDLRSAVRASADTLAEAFRMLSESSWAAVVRTATGRDVPAGQVPWLRVREVGIHAVDLAGPVTFEAFAPDVLEALIDDVATFRAGRGSDPSVRLRIDGGRDWVLGAGAVVEVSGSRAALVGWLTGRSEGADLDVEGADTVPVLGRWL